MHTNMRLHCVWMRYWPYNARFAEPTKSIRLRSFILCSKAISKKHPRIKRAAKPNPRSAPRNGLIYAYSKTLRTPWCIRRAVRRLRLMTEGGLFRLYLLRNQYEAVLKAFYAAHLPDLFIESKQLAPAPVHRKAGKFPAHYVRKVRKRANVIEP